MNDEIGFERLLADALHHAAPTSAPPELVPDALAVARNTRRRPRWLALATERPMRRHPDVLVGSPPARIATMFLAAVLAAAIGTLALVAGGLLPRRDLAVVVQSPDVAEATPAGPLPSSTPVAPTPAPPTEAPTGGLVAYNVSEQLAPGEGDCPADRGRSCTLTSAWLANADGSGAARLFPDDFSGGQVVAWSADGTRILYTGTAGLLLTDPSGSDRQIVRRRDLCSSPCVGVAGLALSPDGTRLAFVRTYGDLEHSTVVAILDLASGQVTELESTGTTNRSERCWESPRCEGIDDMPRWSPDGSRLVFARQVMSPEPGSNWTSAAVYLVDPDGRNLERVTPQGFYAINSSWSPDGANLVFINVEMIVNDDRTSVTDQRTDIYMVRPDGTGLLRLTNDGTSYLPRWTTSGRVTFARSAENWVMEFDGDGQAKLGSSLAELSGAGCTSCIYPVPTQPSEGENLAFWQPVP